MIEATVELRCKRVVTRIDVAGDARNRSRGPNDDPNNLQEEHGNSFLNVPNRFVLTAVYETGIIGSGQWFAGAIRNDKRWAAGALRRLCRYRTGRALYAERLRLTQWTHRSGRAVRLASGQAFTADANSAPPTTRRSIDCVARSLAAVAP